MSSTTTTTRRRQVRPRLPESNYDLRDWARKKGFKIAPFGRVPEEVKEAYLAAERRRLLRKAG